MQAEQAEERAAEARRSQLHDEASVEDHVREADRVDPDHDPDQPSRDPRV